MRMTHAFYMSSLDCTYEITSSGGHRRRLSRQDKTLKFIPLASRGLGEVHMMVCGELTGSSK